MAIRPKPAFHPIFEVATTREGSGIALINQTLQTQDEPEASESCSWWRLGRVGYSLFANTISCSPAWTGSSTKVELGLKHGLVVLRVTIFQGNLFR